MGRSTRKPCGMCEQRMSEFVVLAHTVMTSTHLEEDDDAKDKDGGDEVGDIGEVGAGEGLTEGTELCEHENV